MIKGLLIHMWDRARQFLKKMGGVILCGSIIVWGLSVFPRDIPFSRDYDKALGDINIEYDMKLSGIQDQTLRQRFTSEHNETVRELLRAREKERTEKVYMGKIGMAMAPFFEPIGIDWRGSVALLTGFVAKEIVVSSLGILYAVEGQGQSALSKALLNSGMTSLSALSMMIFVLLYVPCLATVVVIMRETGAAKWAFFNIFYTTSVAWCAAFIVYRAGLFFIAD
jgi:ferrous iron transport protein B